MRLQVPASAVAAWAGMHKYECTAVAMAKMWEKADPAALRRAWRARHPVTEVSTELTPQESRCCGARARAAAEAPLPGMHAAVESALARVRDRVEAKTREANDARRATRAAARTAAKTETDRQELDRCHAQEDAALAQRAARVIQREQDDIRRLAYTTRGKHDEKEALRQAAADRGLDPAAVDASSNAAFFRHALRSAPGGHDYAVVGYVDGLTEDYVIEIKNRMRRLFEHIPLYEKVQMHAYMVLADRPRCLWVQRYRGEQESRMVEFDTAWWAGSVLPALHAAVDRFHHILEDEHERNLLLSAVEDAWRPAAF